MNQIMIVHRRKEKRTVEEVLPIEDAVSNARINIIMYYCHVM